MSRGWVIVVVLGAATAAALPGGEEKAMAVGKDGLTFQDKIGKDDPKVKVTDPKLNKSADVASKTYQVRFVGGMKYRIEMTGKDFDAVVAIFDAAGKQVGFDDDSGGETDAKLDFTATKDGAYKVVAGALGPPGAFKLTIGSGVKVEIKPAPVNVDPKVAIVIPKEGLTLAGKVALTDPKVGITLGSRTDQIPGKIHLIKLTAGKKYQFDVGPTADSGLEVPVMALQDKSGKQLEWVIPEVAPRIQILAPVSDTYKLAVAAAKGEGDYALSLREIPLLKEETTVNEVGDKGLKIDGKLSKETRLVCYQVKLEAGKNYQIDLSSPDPKAVDPYLKLYDAGGKLLGENDDIVEMVNLNARLIFRAPATGVFRIDASSFGNLGVGPYTLEVKLKN